MSPSGASQWSAMYFRLKLVLIPLLQKDCACIYSRNCVSCMGEEWWMNVKIRSKIRSFPLWLNLLNNCKSKRTRCETHPQNKPKYSTQLNKSGWTSFTLCMKDSSSFVLSAVDWTHWTGALLPYSTIIRLCKRCDTYVFPYERTYVDVCNNASPRTGVGRTEKNGQTLRSRRHFSRNACANFLLGKKLAFTRFPGHKATTYATEHAQCMNLANVVCMLPKSDT